uniref:Uncharacterized protein n=1 Tax=Rhizophora mucronata TaxID=61149 RepID=A0A2P2PQY6_RHIMU
MQLMNHSFPLFPLPQYVPPKLVISRDYAILVLLKLVNIDYYGLTCYVYITLDLKLW